MTDFQLFLIICVTTLIGAVFVFRKYYMLPDFTELEYLPPESSNTQTPPYVPTTTQSSPVEPPKLLWDTVANAKHSVRVICDEEGLSWKDKNDLCATVGAESGWMSYYLTGPKKGQPVKLENKDKTGKVWSTDWGIIQLNDYYHIGEGKSFPSPQYVLDNPEACIRWMCKQWKVGNANWWIAFKSGAYKSYL